MMFNFDVSAKAEQALVNQFGPNRQADLTDIQAKIKNQINDLRNLLNAPGNPLSAEAKKALLENLQKYENDKANAVLKLGTWGIDFRAKDEEWAKITSSATSLEPIYQALLISYNEELTKAIQPDMGNLPNVFSAKRAVYKLLTGAALTTQVENDKKVLTDWNNALTTQANRLFQDKVNLSLMTLESIFNQKKLVAKYLYMLQKPTENYDERFFTPMNNAIDALKNYLIHPVNGRYMDTQETTNWLGWGVSRTAKLEAALGYCNRIVLNVTGEPLERTGRALTQGNLNTVVGTFSLSLNGFFQQIRSPGTTSPTSSPTIQSRQLDIKGGSPSSSPSMQSLQLNLAGGSSPSSTTRAVSFTVVSPTTAPNTVPQLTLNPTSEFSATVNNILLYSQAVLIAPREHSFAESYRNKLINNINEFNRGNLTTFAQRGELLDNLGQLICLSPFYQDGQMHIGQLCALEKQLVMDKYKQEPTPSVTKFLTALTNFVSDKYQVLQGSNGNRDKLFATLTCFQTLIKYTNPEEILAGKNMETMHNGAFVRQGIFKELVNNFIKERNAEKAAGVIDDSRLDDKVRKDQEKRIAAASSSNHDRSSLAIPFSFNPFSRNK